MYVIISIGDNMEPVHIVTEKENIAPLVLLPGDPLRAKYIAETFLTDVKLVNDVRNMYAFTGFYKGVRITVMGSGMGCPSMGIYAYELYQFYDVQKIIRIGTSGSLNPDAKILDVILSTGAYSESAFAYSWGQYYDRYIEASLDLNMTVLNTAKELNINVKLGPTFTSDVFDVYTSIEHLLAKCPIRNELLCAEMEGFALMHVARICERQATMMATVVDSKYQPDIIVSPEDRETSLNTMITLALESIIK